MTVGLIIGTVLGMCAGVLVMALLVVAREQEPADRRAVRLIQEEALDRLDGGRSTYGMYNPETDQRDLYEEMVEELEDVMNYAAFEIQKLRQIKTALKS